MEVWCLASTSPVKLEAARRALPGCDVRGVKTSSKVPEQPFGTVAGLVGANTRLEDAKRIWREEGRAPPTGWISVESFVAPESGEGVYSDRALVIAELHAGPHLEVLSKRVNFPAELYHRARAASPEDKRGERGCSVTVGDIIHMHDPAIPKDDWQKSPEYGGVSRVFILEKAIRQACEGAMGSWNSE